MPKVIYGYISRYGLKFFVTMFLRMTKGGALLKLLIILQSLIVILSSAKNL